MPVYGQGRKRILVVGEAPGADEDEQNRPFIGKAGQHLRKVLGSIGINLDKDCWTTNSLICRPQSNRTPDAKEIGYCRPNLLNAIRTYEPVAIVTLGRCALASVLEPYWGEIGTLERWVGWKIPLQKHWICPTYHPSYLLRMQSPLLDRMFASDLESAFDLKTLPRPQEDLEKQIEIIYQADRAKAAIDYFEETGGWLADDIETNCLKPEWPEARIYTCALSNGKRTTAFLWEPVLLKPMSKLLRSNRTKKIASNLKMEERWTIKTFGHGVNNWGWDIMLAAHCLDNRPGICSLKFQALVKLGVPVYNTHIEPYLENKRGSPYNRIQEIDLRELLLYNGMDALLEYRLAMLQRKELGYE